MSKSVEKRVLAGRDYVAFVAELKERILTARISAARAVNRDLILLYWDIGRGIVERQTQFGWGKSVVERLAKDIQKAFPGLKGFSAGNLWAMRRFFVELTAPEFLQQAVEELGRATGPAILPPCGGSRNRRGSRDAFGQQAASELKRASTPADRSEILAQLVREFVASIPWGINLPCFARAAQLSVIPVGRVLPDGGHRRCRSGRLLEIRTVSGRAQSAPEGIAQHIASTALTAAGLARHTEKRHWSRRAIHGLLEKNS